MNEQNDKQKQETGACAPGCSCGTSRSGGRGRWIAGVVVLLIAAALVAKAMMKNNGAQAANVAPSGFAALAAPAAAAAEETPAAKPDAVDTIKELVSLSDLNVVAADTVGVFVFVPGKSETTVTAPMSQMQGAARTIEPQLRGKVGIFTLKTGSRDYEQITMQMAVPGVLAMVKGGGMSATSGDVTESKLIQAFAAASSSGGCGPSSAGCGPGSAGCN
jgi:hypothetical protein